MADAQQKRRIRVRAGHRSSIKKTQTKAEGLLHLKLSGLNPSEITEFKTNIIQKKQALEGKLETIQKLDQEVLDFIDEDNIETEIEHTDELQYSIETLLVRLELSQRDLNVPSAMLNQPNIEINNPTTGTESITPVSSAETSVSQSSPSHSPQVKPPNVKLPKLDLRKFKGDPSLWQPFWETFSTAIHENKNLSDIDKFNYLNSLLEGPAAESVSGLALTPSNYHEATTILLKRFGNRQQIIGRHMKNLVKLQASHDMRNLRGIRQLYDNIEANVRSLKSMGIPSSSFGSLLSPIVIEKLPSELQLIVSREVKEDEWNLEEILEIVEREIEARERTSYCHQTNNFTKPNQFQRRLHHSNQSTAATLFAGDTNQYTPTCTYCHGQHSSNSCKTVTSIENRKQHLIKTRRCFICLRKDHISRNCTRVCHKCHARHHISICPETHCESTKDSTKPDRNNQKQESGSSTNESTQSSVMYANHSNNEVLLQTGRVNVFNPDNLRNKTNCRILFDTGSQRTYITSNLKDNLKLRTVEETPKEVEVVKLSIKTTQGNLTIIAFVVPLICQPLSCHELTKIQTSYNHLSDIKLADYPEPRSNGSVHILIGSDHYWDFITGRVKRGEEGPIAVETAIGWILSGPTLGQDTKEHTLVTTLHIGLEEQLKRFWELEAIGIQPNQNIYEDLTQTITFHKGKYQVQLPWKNPHPVLPDNYQICRKRLKGCYQRLLNDSKLLHDYNNIIQDQIRQNIVEVVKSPETSERGTIHYLPHHPVIRNDKVTTKIRIVYDASAKTNLTPSLNDCLYTGPSMNQTIFDIILRFRSHRIALTGDIEKAFLMIQLPEEDRDVLRFLWFDDVNKKDPDIITLRFTRIVFGVNSSPFLLNATIKYHMDQFKNQYPDFVQRFMRSIYVDDLTTGANTEEEAFELYQLSKSTLSQGGFNLRKFITNSPTLQDKINQEEISHGTDAESKGKSQEDDQTFTKSALGTHIKSKTDATQTQRILGVEWDYDSDEFVFNLREIAKEATLLDPTKRNIVSVTSKFIIQFKILFQEVCKANLEWDELVQGELLSKWNQLVKSMSEIDTITIPRYYLSELNEQPSHISLVGFCDASCKAYAAVVYLRIETVTNVYVKFVASKTRVAPTSPTTIPRLELLSALILARLIVSIKKAIEFEIDINQTSCFTDSKVTLYWIQQQTKEWKQFVQNRVNEIRTLTNPEIWNHISGIENPADLPSRGINLTDLYQNTLWKEGPPWLHTSVLISPKQVQNSRT